MNGFIAARGHLIWHSTPYNAQIVIKMLRQIEFTDVTHPIYQGIFRYLENTEHKAGYGWFFSIPSNDEMKLTHKQYRGHFKMTPFVQN